MPADWQLPPGVSRSLWEFAADRELPSQESSHLGQSPLLTFDAQLVPRWFSTPGPLVDLGCGSGRSLVDFAAAGFACTGVDLSQPSLEFAAQALRDRGLHANLLRANLCELDQLPAEQFDDALLLFGTLGMIATPPARQQALGLLITRGLCLSSTTAHTCCSRVGWTVTGCSFLLLLLLLLLTASAAS